MVHNAKMVWHESVPATVIIHCVQNPPDWKKIKTIKYHKYNLFISINYVDFETYIFKLLVPLV